MNTHFLAIPKGRSGFFVCVAFNDITSEIAVATYNVTNVLLSAADVINWLIPAFCLFIVGFIVSAGVLRKCLIGALIGKHVCGCLLAVCR